jgi:AraC-like DNA-binding protein
MTEKPESLAESPNQRFGELARRGDVLSEVLDIVHVHGERAAVIAPQGPQTISFPNAMPCLHIVEHGEIVIQIEGELETYTVKANQLALLLQGHAHHVRYGDGGPETFIDNALEQHSRPSTQQFGTGNTVKCFWGSFSFYGDLAESVLNGLPSIIVIRDLKQDPIEWLAFSCQIILDEKREKNPGANVMVSRILDLMLVQILRRWARDAQMSPGWLASAQDERISRAVTAIHENAAYNWSIEALSDLCGMSRSSFVTLFEKVMRQAPGAYLREWRLARSAKLLRFSGATVETISEQVGYTSKEAFSRAFRKRFGKSPSKWRSAP